VTRRPASARWSCDWRAPCGGALRGATLAAYGWLSVAVWLGLSARVALAAALPLPSAAWRVARVADHRDPAAF
jgi:hypothetical protein